jgi:hypothetical protein
VGEYAAWVFGVVAGRGSFGVHLEGQVVQGEESFHAERGWDHEKCIVQLEGTAKCGKRDGACRS